MITEIVRRNKKTRPAMPWIWGRRLRVERLESRNLLASFEFIPTPDGYSSTATAISADGSTAAGYVTKLDSQPFDRATNSAFVWSETLGLNVVRTWEAVQADTYAHSLSGDGSVAVGVYHNPVQVTGIAWLSADERNPTDIYPLLTDIVSASSISEDGRTVIGRLWTGRGIGAYEWSPDLVPFQGDVLATLAPDQGIITSIVDSSYTGDTVAGNGETLGPFVWRRGQGIAELPAQSGDEVFGLSGDGKIAVGTSALSPGGLERVPVRWTAAGAQQLAGTSAGRANAASANADVIVGSGSLTGATGLPRRLAL